MTEQKPADPCFQSECDISAADKLMNLYVFLAFSVNDSVYKLSEDNYKYPFIVSQNPIGFKYNIHSPKPKSHQVDTFQSHSHFRVQVPSPLQLSVETKREFDAKKTVNVSDIHLILMKTHRS